MQLICLRNSDTGGSSAAPTPTTPPPPGPGQGNDAGDGGSNPAPGAAGAPPPAGNTVVHGTRTEREVNLQAELDAANKRAAELSTAVKDRETQVSKLQDENRALKQAATPVRRIVGLKR